MARLTRGLRRRAHALDALEERVPFVAPQRVAEQAPEQPHVRAQRAMRIVGGRMRRCGGGYNS
jgi:hypothetical protein